jgi:hypothetical protein
MIDADRVLLDTRIAGQVTRYHTWPRIREQSVGEHSWQILRIYSCVTEALNPNFVMHCIYHDTAEITTGDLPYPIKSHNEALKECIDTIEGDAILKQFQYWEPVGYMALGPEQRALFKLIEMVEMFEWGLDEMYRGSQFGTVVANRCLKFVYEQLKPPLPPQWKRLAWYVLKRLKMSQIVIPSDEEWWCLENWEKMQMIDVKFLHPRASWDHVGIIPQMLDANNPKPAREQLNDGYQHGGGWHPIQMEKWTLFDDNSIQYPEDPVLIPIAEMRLRDELILVYEYSMVAIIQPNRSFEVSRMD